MPGRKHKFIEMKPNITIIVNPDFPKAAETSRGFTESNGFVIREVKFSFCRWLKHCWPTQGLMNKLVPENEIEVAES